MTEADDKGIGAQASELLSLIVAYAKQETVEPIKGLGRYMLWGVIGATLLTAGGVMATITALRVIQTEAGRHLSGELTWVPYLGAALVPLAGMAWAGLRLVKGDKATGGGR